MDEFRKCYNRCYDECMNMWCTRDYEYCEKTCMFFCESDCKGE